MYTRGVGVSGSINGLETKIASGCMHMSVLLVNCRFVFTFADNDANFRPSLASVHSIPK